MIASKENIRHARMTLSLDFSAPVDCHTFDWLGSPVSGAVRLLPWPLLSPSIDCVVILARTRTKIEMVMLALGA